MWTEPGVMHQVTGPWPHAGVLGEDRLDEVHRIGGHMRRELDGGFKHDLLARLGLVSDLKRRPPHQQLVGQHATRPDIALQGAAHKEYRQGSARKLQS